MTDGAGQIFLDRSRYYLSGEYLPKICQSVAVVPADKLWQRKNESSNSIGNLLMHLAGNVGLWIVDGVGGMPFERDRAREFSTRDGSPAEALISRLKKVMREADGVLARLSVDELVSSRTIQDRETTVLGAIYHVVEHFAMHAGQIVLLAKEHSPDAIHFYDDFDNAARPLWGETEGMPEI